MILPFLVKKDSGCQPTQISEANHKTEEIPAWLHIFGLFAGFHLDCGEVRST